ncbi:MAG: DUF4418 family protein [Candidatus Methanoplasma sp.]|jgi:hypothetical protein|nr:DUF4418 family protein [Candidatus Methanoplasma sp.]
MVKLNLGTIISLAIVAVGLLIAIGPQPGIGPFDVCEPGATKMVCYWTSRAELGIGAVIALLGSISVMTSLFEKFRHIGIGLGIGVMINSALAAIMAVSLIGICANEMMHCHDHALPAPLAITILSVLLILLSAIFISVSRKTESA